MAASAPVALRPSDSAESGQRVVQLDARLELQDAQLEVAVEAEVYDEQQAAQPQEAEAMDEQEASTSEGDAETSMLASRYARLVMVAPLSCGAHPNR